MNSGADSPDWLRSFQPPTESAIELSSGSESPLDHSPGSDGEDNMNLRKLFKKEAAVVSESKDNDDGRETTYKPATGKSPSKNGKAERTPERKRKNEDDNKRGKRVKENKSNRRNRTEKQGKSHEDDRSIWSLSSDSESSPDEMLVNDRTIKRELSGSKDFDIEDKTENIDILLDHDEEAESPKKRASKVKSPVKSLEKEDEKSSEKIIKNSMNGEIDRRYKTMKEDIAGKHTGPQVSSSRMPLLLPEKVQRSKALVECEGDSIDLSGDVGSVGRMVISDDASRKPEMFLDLKGTIYKTTILPSKTFCVVSFGQSEAKIEAIMNDYIQLKPQSNIYDGETMVEGTLDGFSFDSEDEADKANVEADQQEAAEEQPDRITKKKPDKILGVARKSGRPAGGKQPKKVKKKPQVSKKGKTKK